MRKNPKQFHYLGLAIQEEIPICKLPCLKWCLPLELGIDCNVRYWKRLPYNILKLKELCLLRSVYMVKVLYHSDPFYCPFSSISFDDYSNFFWYKSICSALYKVCAMLMMHTCNACEGVQYQWGTTLSTHERLLVNSNKWIIFPPRYWTPSRILQVCLKSIVCVLENLTWAIYHIITLQSNYRHIFMGIQS